MINYKETSTLVRFSSTLIILFYLSLNLIFSQNRANYWVFNGFNLDFNNNEVIVSENNFNENPCYGFSSICDNNSGNLLFYSNSNIVFDNNNSKMLNGDSLTFNICLGASLIVPKPDNSSIYYIINYNPSYCTDSIPGLYYSILDLSLNDGYGKVIEKRIKLLDSTITKITAVYHKNYKDVWIITCKPNEKTFYSFLLSANGISTPIISKIVTDYRLFNITAFKASPDGNKIVAGYSNAPNDVIFDLFDFNSETGKITNSRSFTLLSGHCSGAEFSSNCSKLYVHNSNSNTLYQYDLTSNDINIINNSKTEILKPIFNDLHDFQIAPNGKIYFTKGGGQNSGTGHFGVINNPNELGINCNAIENGLSLDFGSSFVVNLPSFIQSYFFKNSISFNGHCLNELIEFNIANTSQIDSVLWQFGDKNSSKEFSPKHKYTKASEYLVKLFIYYVNGTEVIQKKITIDDSPKINLGTDSTVCFGYKLILPEGLHYLWNNNSNKNFIIPYNSGKYWVKVSNQKNCSVYDTVNLAINPVTKFNIGNDTVVCENRPFKLALTSKLNNCTYLWNNGSDDSEIIVNSAGIYWLKVQNSYSCTFVDSIKISNKIPLNLGNDTTILPSSILQLNAGSYLGAHYIWDDFSTNQFRNINGNQFGLGNFRFYVKVTSNNCTCSDTINVRISFQTDIVNENSMLQFNVFPNPFEDYIRIFTKDHLPLLIKIYSNEGREIFRMTSKSNNNIINTSSFLKGNYYIKIENNSSKINILKIIKK